MSSPVLELRGVSRRYGERLAVDAADLALSAGRIACLLGPSGCGKSTLLRLIAGLEPVDEGAIAIGGQVVSAPGLSIAPEDRGVGLVFQDSALFPHLTVTGNVGFGLAGTAAQEKRDKVTGLLARFHIGHLADAFPHTLSGGEQQRVAIARAFAREPAILLLDEPFSGLDGQLRADVRQSVLADLRAAGASVLIVTHDPEEALLIADDLALMADGRILQTGAPEECYAQPVSLAAARLLGDAVAVPAQVSGGVAQSVFGAVPAPGLADGPALAMLRPEDLHIGAEGVEAKVLATGFAGPFRTVGLAIGDVRVTARLAGEALAVGETVRVSRNPTKTRIFPA